MLQGLIEWTLEDVSGGTEPALVHNGIGEAAGEAVLGLLIALDEGWDKHLAKLCAAAVRILLAWGLLAWNHPCGELPVREDPMAASHMAVNQV